MGRPVRGGLARVVFHVLQSTSHHKGTAKGGRDGCNAEIGITAGVSPCITHSLPLLSPHPYPHPYFHLHTISASLHLHERSHSSPPSSTTHSHPPHFQILQIERITLARFSLPSTVYTRCRTDSMSCPPAGLESWQTHDFLSTALANPARGRASAYGALRTVHAHHLLDSRDLVSLTWTTLATFTLGPGRTGPGVCCSVPIPPVLLTSN